MKAKFINEKFEEESDPIANIGIGGIDVELLNKLVERRKKLEKDIEALKEKATKQWENYLRKLFVGKTITAEMQRLATYDTKTMQQKSKSEKGKFTVFVEDLRVENIEHEYNRTVIFAGRDKTGDTVVYQFAYGNKIYIR